MTPRGDESQARTLGRGKALLARLRSGLTSMDLIHYSDHVPSIASSFDLRRSMDTAGGRDVLELESAGLRSDK